MIARALIVGVAHYRAMSGALPAVAAAVADMAAVLTQARFGAQREAVTVLENEEATADAIRAAFAEAAATSRDDEGAFVFYFSGHGERAVMDAVEESFLLPYDTDLARVSATALSSREIIGLLGAVPAKRQVVLIDACHAGGIGATKSRTDVVPKGFGNAGVAALAQGGGRAILTSSREHERSAILVGDRNSVFTTTLLEALNGATIDRGDGAIGVLDVFGYVAEEVPNRVEQHPLLHAGHLEGNFPLGRRPSARASAALSLNNLVSLFSSLYPAGPLQDGIWSRAAGDVSQLVLTGSGRAQWHSALTKVRLGGGGTTMDEILSVVEDDFPSHPEVISLTGSR